MEKIRFSRIEHRLLVLCSQINLCEQDRNEIISILKNQKLDMDYLILLAKKHKVLQLITNHLINLDIDSKISSPNKIFLKSFYLSTKNRNEIMFDELRKVLTEFHRRNIKAIPLKGAILAPNLYKDLGLRILNDIDFLISLDSRNAASSSLKDLGYNIGLYNWVSKEVNQISREEELMWKMHVGNLYPHTLALTNEYCDFVSIDFSYDVDLKKDYMAANKLLNSSEISYIYGAEAYLLSKIDFLIHLCIHLYKEATNVQWVIYHADLNLIKFCDVREYTKTIMGEIDSNLFYKRVKELKAEESVFYTYYYIDYLFTEDFSSKLNEKLAINEIDYLSKYGYNDYDSPVIWKKSFYERFFSISNLDELEELSKLEKNKIHY